MRLHPAYTDSLRQVGAVSTVVGLIAYLGLGTVGIHGNEWLFIMFLGRYVIFQWGETRLKLETRRAAASYAVLEVTSWGKAP